MTIKNELAVERINLKENLFFYYRLNLKMLSVARLPFAVLSVSSGTGSRL